MMVTILSHLEEEAKLQASINDTMWLANTEIRVLGCYTRVMVGWGYSQTQH